MEKLVYIVRHGQTDFNKKGIIQGQGVDTSLNDTGVQQAQAFFHHYKEVGFQAVLTSTLRRTHETMSPFIDAGLPWEQHPEINEIDWGIHEGKKSTPEMHADYKRIVEAWNNGDYSAGVKNGESAAEMEARLRRFVDMLLKRPEEKLLVCSHGRAMRALMCVLDQQPLSQMHRFQHHNTGLYQIAHNGQRVRFLKENDLRHLKASV
jgi:probable phosphoglycerate mutase